LDRPQPIPRQAATVKRVFNKSPISFLSQTNKNYCTAKEQHLIVAEPKKSPITLKAFLSKANKAIG